MVPQTLDGSAARLSVQILRCDAVRSLNRNIASLMVVLRSSIASPVYAQPEAAVRRAAIPKKLSIELHIPAQSLFLRLLHEKVVTMFALRAYGNLDATPYQVVTLGQAIFAHMVEGALFRQEIRMFNDIRLHGTPGYLSPAEVKKTWTS